MSGVYRSISAGVLWKLLLLDRALAVPQSEGAYEGRRRAVRFYDVAAHLRGDLTLGFAVLRGSRALFGAIDVDAMFPRLFPEITRIVQAIGGDALVDACFITEGSDQERGKLIVCFAEPAPTRFARTLVQSIRQRIRACQTAEGIESALISAYPQRKSGGLVRVLGRNPARDGPIERACRLDGEVSDLVGVQPIALTALAAIAQRLGNERPPWVERYLREPWVSTEGSKTHYRRMVALAREAIREQGSIRGDALYCAWLDQIKISSPQLDVPSLKTRDRRNVLEHGRRRAWEYARRNPTSWEPLRLSRREYPQGVIRIYDALVRHARANGLPPARFAIDYERLGALMQCPKSTAWRRASRARTLGLIEIRDPGSRDARGKKGQCAVFGLRVIAGRQSRR